MNQLIDTNKGLNLGSSILRIIDIMESRESDSQGGIECPMGLNIQGRGDLCYDCVDYRICMGANAELGVPVNENLDSVVELSLRG